MKIRRKKKVNIIVIIIFSVFLLLLLSTYIYYKYNKNLIGDSGSWNTDVSIDKETELRTGPSGEYPAIRKVSSGEVLKKKNEESDWIEVITEDNSVGWIPLWDVTGSTIKSPEEKMYEKLRKYTVLLNPIYEENNGDYNLEVAKLIKAELEKENINVLLSREDNKNISISELSKLSKDKNATVVIDIRFFEDVNYPKGISLYYNGITNSQLLSKYIEKNLSSNYSYKVNSAKKNDSLVQIRDSNITHALLVLGNKNSKSNEAVMSDNIYKNQAILGIKRGIREYLYHQLKVEDFNIKRKDDLLSSSIKGLKIPFYYVNEERYRNIPYGNDGSKNIGENGDAIVALAMLEKYYNQSTTNDVKSISEWAGNKYYRNGQGTLSTIVNDFTKQYGLKNDPFTSNQMYKVEESLKNNRPVLVQFKAGKFGNRINYKIIRGIHNNRYYINDPLDDNEKLNSYSPFLREEIEKNMLRAWEITK